MILVMITHYVILVDITRIEFIYYICINTIIHFSKKYIDVQNLK